MKAISPVIATVIIVAVTIAIAIAVALWLSGMVSPFTAVENLQVVSAYATKNPDGTFTVHMKVRNVGTTTATVDIIFINNVPITIGTGGTGSGNVDGGSATVNIATGSNTLSPGSDVDIQITLTGFRSGQMIDIKIHTASGKDYPKSVTLP